MLQHFCMIWEWNEVNKLIRIIHLVIQFFRAVSPEVVAEMFRLYRFAHSLSISDHRVSFIASFRTSRTFHQSGKTHSIQIRRSFFGHTGKLDPDGILGGYGTESRYVRWVNPRAAELIDRARETSGFEARKRLYDEALEIMAREVPFLFLGSSYRYVGLRKQAPHQRQVDQVQRQLVDKPLLMHRRADHVTGERPVASTRLADVAV